MFLFVSTLIISCLFWIISIIILFKLIKKDSFFYTSIPLTWFFLTFLSLTFLIMMLKSQSYETLTEVSKETFKVKNIVEIDNSKTYYTDAYNFKPFKVWNSKVFYIEVENGEGYQIQDLIIDENIKNQSNLNFYVKKSIKKRFSPKKFEELIWKQDLISEIAIYEYSVEKQ